MGITGRDKRHDGEAMERQEKRAGAKREARAENQRGAYLRRREEEEQRRSARRYTIGFVAFLIFSAALLLWNSNIIQRNLPAVSVNGKSYSAAIVNYFYSQSYNSYVSDNNENLELLGLDTSVSLKKQDCLLKSGSTWHDYFIDDALEDLRLAATFSQLAEQEGYDETDTFKNEYDGEIKAVIETLDMYASMSGYTRGQYIKAAYGATMTERALRECVRMSTLATSYEANYINSLTYTDDELQAEFDENPAKYSNVNFEYAFFSFDPVEETTDAAEETTEDADTDADTTEGTDADTAEGTDADAAEGTDADATETTETVEMTEEEKKAAAAAQREKALADADSLMAGYRAGKNFAELAQEMGGDYSNVENYNYAESAVLNWVFDEARVEGEIGKVEDESMNGVYVALFHSRRINDYQPVSVRHILVEDEETANDLLTEWKESSTPDEETFAAMATEHSTDTGSTESGGLYEDIPKGQMVDEFENWCFDPARQPGDTGIVPSSYGYHIMYFVEKNPELYWKLQATYALQNEAYETWYQEKLESVVAERKTGLTFVV